MKQRTRIEMNTEEDIRQYRLKYGGWCIVQYTKTGTRYFWYSNDYTISIIFEELKGRVIEAI